MASKVSIATSFSIVSFDILFQGLATATALETELYRIQDALSIQETEDTWNSIAKAVQQLTALFLGSAALSSQDLVRALRSVVHPVNDAILSERSRLSAVAIDFLTSTTREVPRAFEALIPNFFPTLLLLSSRSNKVFITRARACIIAIVQTTQSPLILAYLVQNARDKSISLRLTVAEAGYACLNSFNPPDLQREARSKEIEHLIKCAATDANPDIRKLGKKMYDAYKVLLPERVERCVSNSRMLLGVSSNGSYSFTAPLTPTIRKYLNISSRPPAQTTRTGLSQSSANPPSRPTSALSTRSGMGSSSSSAPAESQHHRKTTNESSTSHARSQPAPSSSLSSLGAQQSSGGVQPPIRPHSVLGTVTLPSSTAASTATTSQTKARRHEMPPPDYIPVRSQPTRPPVAESSFAEQRQRTGPLRPTTTQSLSQDAPAHVGVGPADVVAAMKRAGGARRVLRPDVPPTPEASTPKALEPEFDLAQIEAPAAAVSDGVTRQRATSVSESHDKPKADARDASRRPAVHSARAEAPHQPQHTTGKTVTATRRPTSRAEVKQPSTDAHIRTTNPSSHRDARADAVRTSLNDVFVRY